MGWQRFRFEVKDCEGGKKVHKSKGNFREKKKYREINSLLICISLKAREKKRCFFPVGIRYPDFPPACKLLPMLFPTKDFLRGRGKAFYSLLSARELLLPLCLKFYKLWKKNVYVWWFFICTQYIVNIRYA